ncbi:MAG: hypothetical protein R6U02_03485 [Alkalibacterium sp.]
MPINQIDNRKFDVPEANSIIRQLQAGYEKEIVKQCGKLTN